MGTPLHGRRRLFAIVLGAALVAACSSTSTADEQAVIVDEPAEVSSTEVIITGTGGPEGETADGGTIDSDTADDATAGAGTGEGNEGSSTDAGDAAADRDTDSTDRESSDDTRGSSGDNDNSADDSTTGSTNPPADDSTTGSTNPAADATSNPGAGAGNPPASGSPDDNGTAGGACAGAEPDWPVQDTLTVDLDGDGEIDTIRTYSSPRDETVLGVVWGAQGGWTNIDVGALPDDGAVEIVGAPDLDGDGWAEILVASPGPLPDQLVQIAQAQDCTIGFVTDSRTGGTFESVTFARFDGFAGITCLPAGVSLVFGSLSGDDGVYRLSRSDAGLVGGTLVFDEAVVDVQPVDDVGDLAPIVSCS